MEAAADSFDLVQMSVLERLLLLGVLALDGRRRRHHCWSGLWWWYCMGCWNIMLTLSPRISRAPLLGRHLSNCRVVGLQEASNKWAGPVRSVSPRWIFRLRVLRRTCEKIKLSKWRRRFREGDFTILSIPRSTELSSLRELWVVEARMVVQTRSWWFTWRIAAPGTFNCSG